MRGGLNFQENDSWFTSGKMIGQQIIEMDQLSESLLDGEIVKGEENRNLDVDEHILVQEPKNRVESDAGEEKVRPNDNHSADDVLDKLDYEDSMEELSNGSFYGDTLDGGGSLQIDDVSSNSQAVTKALTLPFPCRKCDLSFAAEAEREVHFKDVHCTCKICGFAFKNFGSLRDHLRYVHSLSLDCQGSRRTSKMKVHGSSTNAKKKKIIDRNMSMRNASMRGKSPEMEPEPDEVNGDRSDDNAEYWDEDEDLSLMDLNDDKGPADKSTQEQNKFMQLKDKQKSSNKEFPCPKCVETFDSKAEQDTHFRRIHCRCQLCGLMYKRYKDLLRHCRLKHSGGLLRKSRKKQSGDNAPALPVKNVAKEG